MSLVLLEVVGLAKIEMDRKVTRAMIKYLFFEEYEHKKFMQIWWPLWEIFYLHIQL